MKLNRARLIPLLALPLMLTACDPDDAGDAVEDAVENTGDAVEEVGDEIGDAARKAKDKIDDGVKK